MLVKLDLQELREKNKPETYILAQSGWFQLLNQTIWNVKTFCIVLHLFFDDVSCLVVLKFFGSDRSLGSCFFQVIVNMLVKLDLQELREKNKPETYILAQSGWFQLLNQTIT
jgi:uncharacterized membrane protein